MKDKRIKVSVIVPAYNEEKYLDRCLKTLVHQTLKEIEIILVDDGSSDGTYELCEKYQKDYPEKVVVFHKPKEGLGPARNSGIAASKGEYIGFVDADDWVELDMYQSMYKAARKNNSDAVVCDVRKIFVAEEREVVEVSLLLSNCNVVSYIQRPFNTYYKRPGSITTSYTNIRLMDMMQAYKDAAYHANEKYRDETVFCVAKRILINMRTPGLAYYTADFMELIDELMPLLESNVYIAEDENVRTILEYKGKETIPKNIICEGESFDMQVLDHFVRNYKVIGQIGNSQNGGEVKEAIRTIHELGGIFVKSNIQLHIPIGELRTEEYFIVRDNKQIILFGAKKEGRFTHMLYHAYDIEKNFDENIEHVVMKFGKRKNYYMDKYEVIC